MRTRPYSGATGRRLSSTGATLLGGQGRRSLSIGLLLAVLAAAVVGAAVYATAGSSSTGSTAGSASGNGAASGIAAPAKPRTRTRVRALPHRDVANGTESLSVTLSGKPAKGTARPRFSPAVAGTWTDSGTREVFKAASTLQPCTSYRLTVPPGTTAEGHTRLGLRRTEQLQVACPPTRGLQVALARLGYLPESFRTATGGGAVVGAMDRRKAAHLIYHPPAGTLKPDVAEAPPLQYGTFDATTKGAVMVFQEDHKLEATGEAGPQTWAKLLAAVAHKYRDPQPYTFVTVSESSPETLKVHKGSKVVLSSLTNTGVPGAETEQGVFPIYERLTFQMMKGTDPNGYKYNVPVHWINYFNGGDAVHSYERPGYGYPQSNGCVELPLETGHTVFNMLKLGDIVVVN